MRFALAFFATMGFVSPALAQDDACLTEPVEGQKLQRAGKLVQARDRFEICSRNECPAEVVEDCTRWMREVENALPSIVVAARDGVGHDLGNARVSIDGEPPVALTARAIPLDPGAHTIVFELSGSPSVKEEVVLREGEKNRAVVATFGAPPPLPRAPAMTMTRPVPIAAWLLGGTAALGLASFTTFGLIGVSERSAHHCDLGCSSGYKTAVDAELRIADVSLVVGLVALGIATVVYLVRPTVEMPAK